MSTSMLVLAQTRPFFTPSIDTNPAKPAVGVTSDKRHDAGYGTGEDLAPGGAD